MALNIERPQVSSATRESLIGTGETEYSRHNGSYSTSLTAHASVHSLDLLFIQLFEAIYYWGKYQKCARKRPAYLFWCLGGAKYKNFHRIFRSEVHCAVLPIPIGVCLAALEPCGLSILSAICLRLDLKVQYHLNPTIFPMKDH